MDTITNKTWDNFRGLVSKLREPVNVTSTNGETKYISRSFGNITLTVGCNDLIAAIQLNIGTPGFESCPIEVYRISQDGVFMVHNPDGTHLNGVNFKIH